MPCWWQNNCRTSCDMQKLLSGKIKRMLQAASPWEEAILILHRYSLRWPWPDFIVLPLLEDDEYMFMQRVPFCSDVLRSPCFLLCKFFLRCWCWNSWLVGLDEVYLCYHKHAPPQTFLSQIPSLPQTHTHTCHTARNPQVPATGRQHRQTRLEEL